MTLVKAGKNQFRCFHCRNVFANRDGDWFNWDQMQVHLCRKCDKATVGKPERGK
ncbi:MAG: hypothetical protein ACXWPM_01415 [Bdellovibrionota bacterium]